MKLYKLTIGDSTIYVVAESIKDAQSHFINEVDSIECVATTEVGDKSYLVLPKCSCKHKVN